MKDRRAQKREGLHGKSAAPSTAPAWRFMVFVPLAVLWLELVFRLATVERFFDVGLLLTVLFTLSASAIVYLLCTLFKTHINYFVTIGVLAGLGVLYTVYLVYYAVFGSHLQLYSVGMAGDAAEFAGNIWLPIWYNLMPMIAMFVPAVVYAFLGRQMLPARRSPLLLKGLAVIVLVFAYLVSLLAVHLVKIDQPIVYDLYSGNGTPSESIPQFGLLTGIRLDLKQLIFGAGTDISDDGDGEVSLEQLGGTQPSGGTQPPQQQGSTPVDRSPNVIPSLDLAALAESESDSNIQKMHSYFSKVTPTNKNEYTGKFKDKNLIFIVAEGFSPYAVDKDLTPTLYKLSHEGIQCTNYYTPGWGVSTSDGEYTSLLGLMPATGVRSMEYSADRNMYFSLGNLMKKQGYKTYAYHNHTYSYYGRDKSHPNLGYTYKGIGNGLKLDYSSYYTKPTTTRWPNSDYLMALATEEEYMNDGPFHTYYMTVSGHMLYTFMGNSMSAYHRSKVEHLPYSDEVKAYLACQIELDLMVEELVSTLQKKGIADDTVIVLTADHYPYGLQQNNAPDYYSELAGHDTSSTFEKYKNTLIMWHEGLESIVIDEPTYSIDLLPTLCNLFGLEYDSRLLMGRDFLSDSTPLVCFANRSWVTDIGRYDASTKTFTANEGVSVPEGYAKAVSNIVALKFKYADQILKRDYYDILFGK